DRGASWAATAIEAQARLFAIASAGPNELWVAGAGGTLLRSSDGCRSFVTVPHPDTGDLHGVWSSGPSEIFVVGAHGAVLHTRDAGRSFELQRPGGETDEVFTSVWGASPAEVYVGGDRGSIFVTTDGGTHWLAK